jgi:hypothetical protein
MPDVKIEIQERNRNSSVDQAFHQGLLPMREGMNRRPAFQNILARRCWRSPSWMGRAIQVQGSRRAYVGWTWNITPYRVIESDSPAFSAAMRGDTFAVRSLLIDGQVSLFDRDTNFGYTLLHVGVSFPQVSRRAKKLAVGCSRWPS